MANTIFWVNYKIRKISHSIFIVKYSALKKWHNLHNNNLLSWYKITNLVVYTTIIKWLGEIYSVNKKSYIMYR